MALEERAGLHHGPSSAARRRSTRPGDTAPSSSRPATASASTARAARGMRGSGTRAPRPRAGRSDHDARSRGKVARAAPSAAGGPSGGRPTAPIVRCRGPGSVGVAPCSAVPSARPRAQRNSVPDIRPFRALRYDPEVGRRPGPVVAPPYDVIGAGPPPGAARPPSAQRRAARPPAGRARRGSRRAVPAGGADARRVALGRDAAQGPAPVGLRVRAGLPRARHGRGADAARLLRAPAHRAVRARERRPAARADAVGPQGGPLPAAARDRHQHVAGRRPVRGRRGTAAAALARGRRGRPTVDVTDDDGVRHRLWVVADEGEGSPASGLVAAAAAGPVFIADGHHRYETAVRYRDERRTASTEPDPPFDFLLMLFLDAADAAHGPADAPRRARPRRDGLARLPSGLPRLFTVTPDDAGRARRALRGGRRAGRAARAGSGW